MMKELESEHPGAFQLAAINAVGHEDSTDDMAALGDIPLLQDLPTVPVWNLWMAEYRDVVIVDKEGHRVEAYNLTIHNLGDADSYAALKAKLVAALDR